MNPKSDVNPKTCKKIKTTPNNIPIDDKLDEMFYDSILELEEKTQKFMTKNTSILK
jgi:hypothetical protein